ncbi:MAG: roadblock/LC7 domain-containing protein [Deltaproteobacteria bacterium]|nr:roadblock/LC7 domain-containing protein [Deltaproteobacteria bacterium]
MFHSTTVLGEDDYQRLKASIDGLVRSANARVVFLVDKAGQLIAAGGAVSDLDTTSLASLTAGNIAATGGIAKLLRENEFATQYHEGKDAHVHIQVVKNRVILVVIFDARSSLGLVRLRVRKTAEELTAIFDDMNARPPSVRDAANFTEITDEDIDNLFND